MDALLNYDTSPLNPLLKIIAPLLLLGALAIFAATRRYYSDRVRNFLTMLVLFALFAFIAGGLRYFGDGTDFGFTKEYSLRWFQSIFYLATAGCFVLAGRRLLEMTEGDEP